MKGKITTLGRKRWRLAQVVLYQARRISRRKANFAELNFCSAKFASIMLIETSRAVLIGESIGPLVAAIFERMTCSPQALANIYRRENNSSHDANLMEIAIKTITLKSRFVPPQEIPIKSIHGRNAWMYIIILVSIWGRAQNWNQFNFLFLSLLF